VDGIISIQKHKKRRKEEEVNFDQLKPFKRKDKLLWNLINLISTQTYGTNNN